MIPEAAVELVLNALADLPSGTDPHEALAAIQAQTWDEGMEAMHATTGGEWPPIPETNPYGPTP